jgi:hypothetical protein
MIIFELGCESGHRFEGWFGSAGEFDAQLGRGLLECPTCGSHAVAKIPHAKIAVAEQQVTASVPVTPAAQPAPAPSTDTVERFKAVAAFMQQVLAQTEDVGREFPAEARRIHYDEAPSRAIRGTASAAETRELLEEGIAVLPLPIPPRDDWN